MLFKRKPSISDDMRDWIVDSFDWAERQFGTDWAKSRKLITPTNTFFSAPSGDTPEVAQIIADDIAKQIPVPKVPVTPINQMRSEYRHAYQATADVGGMYVQNEDGALILYDPELMRAPFAFINTMAHELMHHRIGGLEALMPGGPEAGELSTDLHCITHGFGIFALEGPSHIGWSGYMTRESRAFAFAYFLQVCDHDVDAAMGFLSKPNQKALTRALKELG